MPQSKDDLSRSLVAFDQNSSLCAVIELSLDKWLVGAIVPGLAGDPLKALPPSPEALLKLLHRWRDEAVKAGRNTKRLIVAFEAGRDGFWLARWLRAKGICHPSRQCAGLPRAAACKNRPAGYWTSAALPHGLATR